MYQSRLTQEWGSIGNTNIWQFKIKNGNNPDTKIIFIQDPKSKISEENYYLEKRGINKLRIKDYLFLINTFVLGSCVLPLM
jgi:hypothetical protein